MKLPSKKTDLRGMKVTVMGLGINGGGLASALFLLKQGVELTITDTRSEAELKPSLDALEAYTFRSVLGRHEERDFTGADFVIKNPAVRPQNPFLSLAKALETDLSLFMQYANNPLLAVTGSKGKSSTASALHHCLLKKWPQARLGGNITVSPLSFLEDLDAHSPVVLELSSFQLGDLVRTNSFKTGQLHNFPPSIGILTNIYQDHQDYYGSMDSYIKDKLELFNYQTAQDYALFNYDDPWTPKLSAKLPAQVRLLSAKGKNDELFAWLEKTSEARENFLSGPRGFVRDAEGQEQNILAKDLLVPGTFNRFNLLNAATAAYLQGVSPSDLREATASYKGIEHRLEYVGSKNKIRFINDSAATIPDAVLAGISSLHPSIHLICGGTNKNLDFGPFKTIRQQVKTLRLLDGTASTEIKKAFEAWGLQDDGCYTSLARCVKDAFAQAQSGDTIILSPGCASFGMFKNEFDRGRQFKACVEELINN